MESTKVENIEVRRSPASEAGGCYGCRVFSSGRREGWVVEIILPTIVIRVCDACLRALRDKLQEADIGT